MGAKGVPFGYLEFSRAIRGKPYHTRAPAAAADRFQSWSRARVPYPVRFFLNRISQIWVTADRTRSAIGIRTDSAQRLTENRRVGRFLSETNRCNGSD